MSSNRQFINTTFVLFGCFTITRTASAQSATGCACNRPFPYAVTTARIPKAQLDAPAVADKVVTDAYDRWKCDYLKPGGQPGELVIKNDEKDDQKDNVTTSEAISYGMVIEALMAGYDRDAKSQFDRLYTYALHHPSQKNKFLMAWAQNKNFVTTSDNDDSAVDGDLDIAYALLVAYKQWGDDRYKAAADSTMAAILAEEIDYVDARIVRGNASVPDDEYTYHVIRMSDFMPAELRSFAALSHSPIWQTLVDKNYVRYDTAQTQFSPNYGLFPDYVHIDRKGMLSLLPEKLAKKYRKGEQFWDGGRNRSDNSVGRFYGLNSCRVPWRIATDYLLNGDPTAKRILDRINAGIIKYTDHSRCLLAIVMKPDDKLSAAAHSARITKDANLHSADLSTIAPLCVAAVTDQAQYAWRRDLQGLLTDDKAYICPNNDNPNKPDYYANTIRLICLLLLSNHYWSPEK